jgi:periplasmic protein TonB
MTLSEDFRPPIFLVPAMVASVAVHVLVLILIGMAARMIPVVIKPAMPKVITVDLVSDRPAVVAPEPEKVLPPKCDRSATIEPPIPEKEPEATPKKKRIEHNHAAPAAVSPPHKMLSEKPNSSPSNEGMADLQVSLSEDNGKVMPVGAEVSNGAEEGGKMVVGIASGSTGKEGAGSGLAEGTSGGVIDAKPLYKSNPPPEYPAIARKRNLEGTVIVLAKISRKGRALEVKIDQSCGHSLLDSAALDAVKAWEFEPGKRRDEPIESMVKLPITFVLK